jgi:hypothetical protein
MRVYVTTLAAPAGGSACSAFAELIRDALWEHTTPLGDVEHITVIALPAGIGIAIFLNQMAADPEEQVKALLSIAARRSSAIGQCSKEIESEGEA